MLNLKRGAAVMALTALMMPVAACATTAEADAAQAAAATAKPVSDAITTEDVLAAQKAWSDGIVAIGETYKAQGDYRQAAADHIAALYAYEQGGVLFKPTLASADQFRETEDEALSYFVGGSIAEDTGFAIRPWANVRWGEQVIHSYGNTAAAMGNYFFTPDGSTEEIKVEYTFVYERDPQGDLRIRVHHSSVPYTP